MPTYGPITITEPTTFRYCCTGPGGIVYTEPFTATPEAECGVARLTSTDPDGIWDPTGPDDPTEEFCLEDCPPGSTYQWEVRVMDPDPNDPQAFVNTTGWQPVNFAGPVPQCFTLTAPNADSVLEAQGFNPITATGLSDLTHTLYFEIRGSCDGGANWFTDSVTIPYFHIDDPELP